MPREKTDQYRQALRKSRRQCPNCGGSRVVWDDSLVIPTMSKRRCKDCGCKWSPIWSAKEVWFTIICGAMFLVTGLCFVVYTIYELSTGHFEYVMRWYNFFFPKKAWPYVRIALLIGGMVLGACMVWRGMVWRGVMCLRKYRSVPPENPIR